MWWIALACSLPKVPLEPAPVSGREVDFDALVDTPGPIRFEAAVSARWAVPLHGLVDLRDPRAADLADGDHPIVLPVMVFTHPDRGVFVVDTGVDTALAAGERGPVRGFAVRGFLSDLVPVESLGAIVERQGARFAGVLLTHTHVDHILGLPDVPADVPVYAGAGELEERGLVSGLLRGTYQEAFEGVTLRAFDPARSVAVGPFRGWDVLGDGSLWALAAPGHTPGSTAYLARTPEGPVLAVGDLSHTVWGWEHGVTPGTYTEDHAENQKSLDTFRAFAAAHPALRVLVGHELTPTAPALRADRAR